MSRTFVIVALVVLALVAALPASSLEGETFSITEVSFADSTITIVNHGDSDVDPNGLIVCNFPDYAPIAGAPTLAPGESAVIDISAIGIPANASEGEMGLYLDSNFESVSSLVAYVEWGSSGHTRSTVGIGAGVWAEGFVDPAGADGIVSSTDTPTSPADWSPLSAAQLPQTGLSTTALAAIAAVLLSVGIAVLTAGRRRDDSALAGISPR